MLLAMKILQNKILLPDSLTVVKHVKSYWLQLLNYIYQ